MKRIVAPSRLEAALIKHGLVPMECRVIDVVIGVGDAPIIRYEVFLTEDAARRFALAFAEAAGEEGEGSRT